MNGDYTAFPRQALISNTLTYIPHKCSETPKTICPIYGLRKYHHFRPEWVINLCFSLEEQGQSELRSVHYEKVKNATKL